MPRDFRASQLQTNKIIASGSSGGTSTNARLLIYPKEADSLITPNQGFINTSRFGLSGIGSDVFMYVSGGIGQRGTAVNSISVFGGDLHVSGNLSVAGTVPSITMGGDITGTNSTTFVDKLQSFTLDLAGLSINDVIRYDGTKLVRSSAPLVNQFVEGTPSPRLRTTASLAVDTSGRFAENIGTDSYFFVSGAINSRNTGIRGTSVFGGDVHISGNLNVAGVITPTQFRMKLLDYAVTANTSSNPEVVAQFVFPGNEYSGTLQLRGILSTTNPSAQSRMRLWNLTSASYVEIGGPGVIELATSNLTPTLVSSVDLIQAVNFSSTTQALYELHLYTTNTTYDVYGGGWELRPFGTFSLGAQTLRQWTEGSPSPRLRTTASIALGSGSLFAEDIGSDVYFFVSGTIDNRGTAGSKITLLSSDVFVSGALLSGLNHQVSNSRHSVLAGGSGNIIRNALGSSVIGGFNNLISTRSTGSFIGGGFQNVISSSDTAAVDSPTNDGSIIGAGQLNTIINKGNSSSPLAILSGLGNYIGIGGLATIVGGFNNVISSSNTGASVNFQGAGAVIVAGNSNTISSSLTLTTDINSSFIGAGTSNKIVNSPTTFIGAGVNNVAEHTLTYTTHGRSFIGAGNNNAIRMASSGSAIIAGSFNEITGSNTPSTSGLSFIGTGIGNRIDSTSLTTNSNVIVAGTQNTVSNSHISSVVNGRNNIVSRVQSSVIAGGDSNLLTNNGSGIVAPNTSHFIGAGNSNSIEVHGSGSVIVGGASNQISGSATVTSRSSLSFVGGGLNNKILTSVTNNFGNTIVGGLNNLQEITHQSFTGGGSNNIISGSLLAQAIGNTIAGGVSNSIRIFPASSQIISHNFIGGGLGNTISGSAIETSRNSVAGGTNNIIFDTAHSFIGGGRNNRLTGVDDSLIVGGRDNLISGTLGNLNDDQIIVGGLSNAITSSVPADMYRNFIGGGENHQIRSTGEAVHSNTIVGGRNHTIIRSSENFIGGGFRHRISSSIDDKNRNAIIGSRDNIITNCNSTVLIGTALSANNFEDSVFIGAYDGRTVATTVSAAVVLAGGIHYNSRVSVALGTGTFTPFPTDYFISFTSATGPISISTTNIQNGRVLILQNSTGGAVTVEGLSMPSGTSQTLLYHTPSWRRIAQTS